jgi:lipopolysaccharide/colanic/teichoic acid biosynthesis glycosyltransferase
LYFFGKDKLENNTKFDTTHIEKINSSQKRLRSNSKKTVKLNSYSKKDLEKSLGHIKRKNINNVISFIWASIKSEKTNKDKISIFNTKTSSNIKFLSNNSKNLIINVHKTNDIRRINEYFLDVYSKLENDGLFIGNFIPLENMSNHLRSRMPHFLYFIIIPFYFIFFRVFPKLTITKQIYFILTGGKNRVLSKAEVLGRLAFCGYEVIEEKIIGYTAYFISRKINTISNEKFPSYGPIVKLKRVGYQGKRVYIYKLRTMYPYSEFIQGHIYRKYDLDTSGKFKNDFRITSWGKFFRSYFIDEIPQLYNWLIGDIKLIGVRALSEHYFGLYPPDIQELRVKSKPGIIPPYYADMPNSFDEILNSEKKYFLEKQKKPVSTDLKYLFKVFYNIAFRGARSR